MRTTINISDKLLQEAQKWTGAKTKTLVVHLGLQGLIDNGKMKRLINLQGKFPLKIDLKSSRKKR